jgi:hypothetical protein
VTRGATAMSKSLVEIRPCLRQAIDLMEQLYESANGSCGIRCPSWREFGPWLAEGVKKLEEELAALDYSPRRPILIDQARVIWSLSVRRSIPAIWFIRTSNPVTALVSATCEVAELPIPRVVNGELKDRDFPRLTFAVGRLASAPLRMCDARKPGAFLNSLPKLFSEEVACYVVCDWCLEGEELAAALQLKDESQISFLWPRI